MGKGDRRSRRSKIWRGTYGKTRPRRKRRSHHQGAPADKVAKKREGQTS